MNKNNLKQILSASLSLALVVSSAPIPAGAIGPAEAAAPAFVAKLTPPEQFGYVASSFAPKGETIPRLIVISNLHGHLEVQQNIMGMLEHYVNQLTSPQGGQQTRVPIYLEGAWDKHMEHPLAPITDPKLRAVLAEYMLRKVEMQAVQAYTERFPKATNFTVTGVDDQSQYERNQAVFAKSYATRRQLLEAIIREEQNMAELENFVASSTYEKVRQMRSDYEKGQITADRYALWLSRMAGRYGIEGASVNTLKKASTVPTGRLEWALLDVHRKVLVKVAQETKPATAYLRRDIRQEKLVKKNLAFAQGYMDILKRLLSNQLTPEEVTYATTNFNQLVQVAQTLLADQKNQVDVAGTLQDALSFYAFAFLRDDALVRNALVELDKDETHAMTGILVVGGFHTSYILDYLRQKQVPFIQISPVITRDVMASEQLNYVKRLCDDHVTIQEAAVDFRQPWMNQVIRDTAARLTASTADIAGGKVGPTGTNLAKGIEGDEPLKRALGITKNGVVDEKLAVQGTKEGLKYFKEGELLGAIDKEVNTDIAAAVVKSQVQVTIDSRGALFKAGANHQWTGEGTEASLYGDLVSELGSSPLVNEDMRNLDRVDEIEIVRSNTTIKTFNTAGQLVREDNMAVLTAPSSTDPTKKRAIIVIHATEQELMAHNKAHQEVIDMKNRGETPASLTDAQNAAIAFFTGIRHEIVHAVTKPGWMLGDLAQSYVNVNMILSEVAKIAGVEALETSTVPTPWVALTLNGMAPLLENMGVSAADVVKELGDNPTVTLGALRDALVKLMGSLDPAAIEANQKALIDNLTANYGISEGQAAAIVAELPLLPKITGKLSKSEQEYVVKRVEDDKKVNEAG